MISRPPWRSRPSVGFWWIGEPGRSAAPRRRAPATTAARDDDGAATGHGCGDQVSRGRGRPVGSRLQIAVAARPNIALRRLRGWPRRRRRSRSALARRRIVVAVSSPSSVVVLVVVLVRLDHRRERLAARSGHGCPRRSRRSDRLPRRSTPDDPVEAADGEHLVAGLRQRRAAAAAPAPSRAAVGSCAIHRTPNEQNDDQESWHRSSWEPPASRASACARKSWNVPRAIASRASGGQSMNEPEIMQGEQTKPEQLLLVDEMPDERARESGARGAAAALLERARIAGVAGVAQVQPARRRERRAASAPSASAARSRTCRCRAAITSRMPSASPMPMK